MITRIELENWKAYEALDLAFSSGTTFIVAANGVGKSSIIQALRWGLFGSMVGPLDPSSCIRAPSDRARVVVHGELSNNSFSISRTVDTVGALSAELLINGEAPSDIDTSLRNVFSADPGFLARTLVVGEREVAHLAEDDVSVYDHLCETFGVSTLFELAVVADEVASQAASEVAGRRQVQKASRTERRELEERLVALDAEVVALDTRLKEHTTALSKALEARTARSAWADYLHRRAEFVATMERLTNEAVVLGFDGGVPDHPEALIQFAEAVELRANEALIDARTREGVARSAIEVAQLATAQLTSGGGNCPLCLRPLAEHEAEDARRMHGEETQRRLADLEQARQNIEASERLQRQVRELSLALRGLVVPSAPNVVQPSDEEVLQADDLAQGQEQLVRQRDLLIAERARIEQQSERYAEAETASEEIQRGYRTEAVSDLLASALRLAARRITERSVIPITREIELRWKRMWDDRGRLVFDAHNGLSLQRNGSAIQFDGMSGGEKVVALLLLRLLTVALTTEAGFFWLDEPLEHLDPRNRRMVASTLVQATRAPPIRQIVVTTYEQSIARRLAESSENCTLISVRSDEPSRTGR